jgi:hypothetical protein
MTSSNVTDLIFCWAFSILGLAAFSMGVDTALYTSYHGAGLMIAIAGLIMIAVSGQESLKM